MCCKLDVNSLVHAYRGTSATTMLHAGFVPRAHKTRQTPNSNTYTIQLYPSGPQPTATLAQYDLITTDNPQPHTVNVALSPAHRAPMCASRHALVAGLLATPFARFKSLPRAALPPPGHAPVRRAATKHARQPLPPLLAQ